ncbi:MAG: ATP-dependent 6-phosphofructokinase, partial [Oscillospiraceae bacterium]
VQRGGTPTLRDRVMASKMSYQAVKLFSQGVVNRIVAFKHGQIMDFDIQEALAMTKTLDKELLSMTKMLNI